MEDEMEWNRFVDHPKTIIHIDIDCFYAQVEILKQPHLQDKPVGIQQKNIVVTCNYPARKFGVGKCMLISEAIKLCPQLTLINGEDLHEYRQASSHIHSLLLSFTNRVEKLGFDENFLDVTDLVFEREKMNELAEELVGHYVGDYNNKCSCGCHERLSIGSQVALEIRTKLKNELGFTSCAGVSYNKLLAKLIGSSHKPNQQTTLFSNGVNQFMLNLKMVDRIPGVGTKTKQILSNLGVRTIKELQNVEFTKLKATLGQEVALNLKNLSLGVDNSIVKQSTKPLTIGLEDGFRKISLESDVKEKFRILLLRLMTLVEEDGRIPMTVKVTVRKFDKDRKTSQKETKQSPVPTGLFSHPIRKLTEEATNRLLNIIMGLFHRIVNISKPFHLTLLGLAFTKDKCGTRSIASFLLKKHDLSVQSLTSFVSNETVCESRESAIPSCSKSESESEAEPSPKKTKIDVVIKKRKLSEEDADVCSPSKLKVAELNLNGDADLPKECPSNVDPEVFKQLPPDVQQELIRGWKRTFPKPNNSSKQSLIFNYCISNK